MNLCECQLWRFCFGHSIRFGVPSEHKYEPVHDAPACLDDPLGQPDAPCCLIIGARARGQIYRYKQHDACGQPQCEKYGDEDEGRGRSER